MATEAQQQVFPTLKERIAKRTSSQILWGCIVFKWQYRRLKNGYLKRYGPYAYHVTKKPPDFSSEQAWDYLGKVGKDRYFKALSHLRDYPLLPNSNNPADPGEIMQRLADRGKSRVGKYSALPLLAVFHIDFWIGVFCIVMILLFVVLPFSKFLWDERKAEPQGVPK